MARDKDMAEFTEDPEERSEEVDALIENQARVNNEGAAHPEIVVPVTDDPNEDEDERELHEYEPSVEIEPGDQATG